jgi:hypothetical protein
VTEIRARVQHHPGRAHLLPRLLHHLRLLSPEVVAHSSDPPDPWAGYRLCLTDLPDCTHVLVIQDDAIPVPGFADALPLVAQANPNTPVCLWMSAVPASCAGRVRRALMRKNPPRYMPLGPSNILPLVAVLWPRALAQAFLEWSETSTRITRADDGNAARWAKQTRQEVMVAVPSICEHDDFTPSVKGGDRKESQGKASDRVALFLADDARVYEW